MLCNEKGIRLTKDEAVALLAFAAKAKDLPNLAVVHFLIDNDRCWAYSTNGHRALECDGESDAKHSGGEWLVERGFLDTAVKLLAEDQTLRLAFSGATLNHALVEDENGEEVSTFQWPRDAAIAQHSFPQVRELIKIPQHKTRAPCVTLNSDYMADLKKVAKAAGRSGVDLYPPKNPDSPLYFRVQTDASTTWTGVIMPMDSGAAEAAQEASEAAE